MDILQDIKPTKQEQIKLTQEVNSFLKRLNSKLKGAKAITGGSFAKNTWLRGNYDIDIFVKFNYKYKDKSDEISNLLQKQLKGFRFTKLHGSRDYFQIEYNKITFEVIPVLEIKNAKQALNVTDVSQLHALYVKNNTNEKLQDEIRLAKQFFHVNNLYGAESYIKGFSGYVLELLIIHYKSLNNFLKAASKWKEKEIIDIKHYYKDKNDVLFSLNEAKKQSPLILIDPVQKDRNASASLSEEKYDLLKKVANSYIKKPSSSYFIEKKFDIEQIKADLKLEITPLKGKQDIIGAKILKSIEYIKNKLDEEGFIVNNFNWHFDKKSFAWFNIKNLNLPKEVKHYGPFLKDDKNIINFKKKWKKYKLQKDNKRVFVIIKRKYTKVNDYLKVLIKDKYIKERVKIIKIIQNV